MALRAHLNPSFWTGGALAAVVLGAAGAASAQPTTAQPTTVEELTVTGRYGPGGELRSLSQTVSYRDLDLTTEPGRAELQARIKTTAHDLCVRLGEPPHQQTPPVPSCEQTAINSTATQQRMAIAQAQPKAAPGQPAPAVVAEAVPPPAAPAAEAAATPASVTVAMTTNGPVPDTPENRKKYGGPMSHAGKRTAAKGN